MGDVVLPQRRQVAPERVGLDEVGPRLEVRAVYGLDDVGTGDVEDLVAPLVPLEVLEGRVLRLEHRAHRPVGDEDAGAEDRT